MIVSELIKFLKDQPQDLLICHGMYSEFLLLDELSITIEEHCQPRGDGWVQHYREDMPTGKYLVFPGN